MDERLHGDEVRLAKTVTSLTCDGIFVSHKRSVNHVAWRDSVEDDYDWREIVGVKK